MIIRPEHHDETDEAAAVGRIVVAAFGAEDLEHGAVVGSLVRTLWASGHVRASLVAVDEDDRVCGHVLLSRSWVDARERLVEALVLSPLSVAPARQGAGVGTALVTAAIEAAGELGAPALFLEGSPSYYGARGFGRASDHGFGRPSVRVPDPAFQVALLPAHEPWMTGALVYCEPFWALDCVGLRDPILARIESELG